MEIQLTREEMTAVLLARIEEMDPEEAREELWEYYSESIFPGLSDEELARVFREKVILAVTEGEGGDEEDEPSASTSASPPSAH